MIGVGMGKWKTTGKLNLETIQSGDWIKWSAILGTYPVWKVRDLQRRCKKNKIIPFQETSHRQCSWAWFRMKGKNREDPGERADIPHLSLSGCWAATFSFCRSASYAFVWCCTQVLRGQVLCTSGQERTQEECFSSMQSINTSFDIYKASGTGEYCCKIYEAKVKENCAMCAPQVRITEGTETYTNQTAQHLLFELTYWRWGLTQILLFTSCANLGRLFKLRDSLFSSVK